MHIACGKLPRTHRVLRTGLRVVGLEKYENSMRVAAAALCMGGSVTHCN
jgi:hypothetical protein